MTRIAIIGNEGVGRRTLARKLAAALSLDVIIQTTSEDAGPGVYSGIVKPRNMEKEAFDLVIHVDAGERLPGAQGLGLTAADAAFSVDNNKKPERLAVIVQDIVRILGKEVPT